MRLSRGNSEITEEERGGGPVETPQTMVPIVPTVEASMSTHSKGEDSFSPLILLCTQTNGYMYVSEINQIN